MLNVIKKLNLCKKYMLCLTNINITILRRIILKSINIMIYTCSGAILTYAIARIASGALEIVCIWARGSASFVQNNIRTLTKCTA
jgi:hypothetical protein